MSTFSEWLFWQVARPDSVGDLARDAMQDEHRPQSSAYAAWHNHLADLGACSAALRVLREAWNEWRTGGGSKGPGFGPVESGEV